jgi:hypothetical protein
MTLNQENWLRPTKVGWQVAEERTGGWTKGRALRSWLRRQGDRFLTWLGEPSHAIILIDGELLRSDGDKLWTGTVRLPWDGGTGECLLRGGQERLGRVNDLSDAFRARGDC